MKLNIYETKTTCDIIQACVQQLQKECKLLPVENQTLFLKQTYFPELVASFYQSSILQFELRLPLGNESHKKAYFTAKFEEMNHFF